jgi:antitoxin ParD1/3/4
VNVSLTPELEDLVARRVSSGLYNSASEVVRDALRLLEQREQEDEAKIAWLRDAAQVGFDDLDRGNYTALRSKKDLSRFMDEIQAEVKAVTTAERKRV